jgi:hypothetical protein
MKQAIDSSQKCSGNGAIWTLSLTLLMSPLTLGYSASTLAEDSDTETISTAPEQETLNKLFSDPALAGGKSVEHLPANVAKDFNQPLKEFGESRSPASIAQKPLAIHSAPEKSRMPASVTDGFEMLVRFGKIVSAFWVVKRGDKLDFVFANNNGSRVAVGLSPESFSFLQSQAEAAAEASATAPGCNQKKIELHVVEEGKPQRDIASCIDAKTKPAKNLRELSELLASFAR